MVFKSNKFNTGRKKRSISGEQKKSLSFTKFIKHADKRITGDPNYDLVADFEFYDINCDYCLEHSKKIVNLYVMQSDEIQRKLGKGELLSAESDLFVKCPNCYQVKRVSDIRKLTSGGTIPTLSALVSAGHVGSSTSDRNLSPIESFSPEVKNDYYNLMRLKGDPNTNQKYIKELENYVKDYAGTVKQFDPAFKNDYQALLTKGLTVVKVENANI